MEESQEELEHFKLLVLTFSDMGIRPIYLQKSMAPYVSLRARNDYFTFLKEFRRKLRA